MPVNSTCKDHPLHVHDTLYLCSYHLYTLLKLSLLLSLVIGDAVEHIINGRWVTLFVAKTITFVISTGDNFYPRGIASAFDDNLLQWEEVYQPRIPWYLALGNHDHRGNVSAQTALTDIMTFWNMPTTYHDVVVEGIRFLPRHVTMGAWRGRRRARGMDYVAICILERAAEIHCGASPTVDMRLSS